MADHVLWDCPLVKKYRDHALVSFRKRENCKMELQSTEGIRNREEFSRTWTPTTVGNDPIPQRYGFGSVRLNGQRILDGQMPSTNDRKVRKRATEKWRPITPLSVVGKGMEKFLARILLNLCEKEALKSDELYEFSNERSTEDAIRTLISQVSNANNKSVLGIHKYATQASI